MNAAIDRKLVRRHFSVSSALYDGHACVQKHVARKVSALVEAEAPVCGRFLEIGTGTGCLTEMIADTNPRLQPVISDLSHAMTMIAREKVPHALALDLDAAALPVKADSLALVCSSSVYQWVENLAAAFGESSRVLEENGVFIFALFGDRTLWELKECYRQACKHTGRMAPDHLLNLPSLAEVKRALHAGGFEASRVWEAEECETHDSVRGLLRSIKGVGAQNASKHRPRGLASRRVMQSLEQLYTDRFGGEGRLPATYHVIYGVARKI